MQRFTVPFLDLRAASMDLGAALEEAYRRVLASGRYVLGDELAAFEEEFARYCGSRHCVGVGCGLDALILILRSLGIGPGDEVLVPAHTYIATWLAVSAVGAHVVAVDPDLLTGSLDLQAASRVIGPRTRALVCVHLYGQPADMTPLLSLAREHGLRVIEDAAQAHGARYQGRRVGALADAAAFSFYPSKNLGALGDGGAVTTDSDALAQRLRTLRNYGSRRKYVHEERGVNSRLDEMQAALLRVKLAHLDAWNDRRAAIAAIYLERLAGLRGLHLPVVSSDGTSAWHLFVVRHPRRDALLRHLSGCGVETLIHYPTPPHLSPAYADLGIPLGALPVTERLAAEVLSLPMGPHLSIEAACAVATWVREFCAASEPSEMDPRC